MLLEELQSLQTICTLGTPGASGLSREQQRPRKPRVVLMGRDLAGVVQRQPLFEKGSRARVPE